MPLSDGCQHPTMVLAQPHPASLGCNPSIILQKAQVSCIGTHLPPASSGQPALSQASSSSRLEQGETWHCQLKNLTVWEPHTTGPIWNEHPFLIDFNFLIGFH